MSIHHIQLSQFSVSKSRQEAQLGIITLPPLSLYIHFPWCVRKCPYCDFNSHEKKSDLDEIGYINALLSDLEFSLLEFWDRPLQSVFLGGGTPSLFSPQAVETLLAGIRARTRLQPGSEITMEANPGTFEAERFYGYRDAGVNRLSIGIQSFSSRHLQVLGRIHDGDGARRAIEIALRHFENVNLDLMYALPGQTLDEAMADLDMALSYDVTHLSVYQLTIEPNTLFAVETPHNLPDNEMAAAMQEGIEARLADAGFQHYEISAFARPDRRAQHNLNYWQFGDYLGIGAGAHSKISTSNGIVRQLRHKKPSVYLQAIGSGSPMQHSRKVTRDELPFEFMMNLLRLTDGFPLRLFQERTGLPLSCIQGMLTQAEEHGLITWDAAMVQTTLKGQRFLNDLLIMFLTDKTTSNKNKNHPTR